MAPALNYPGVYLEEVPSAVHRIPGVAGPIPAFVGWAPLGPVNHATLVRSWREFQVQFGGLAPGSHLGHAVKGFFSNGGQQAYVVRVITAPMPGNAALAALPQAALANIPRRIGHH